MTRRPRDGQRRRARAAALAAGGLVLVACGGARPSPSTLAKAQLGREEFRRAEIAAPDLGARARMGLRLAQAAERDGQALAAEDYATASRLYADATLYAADAQAVDDALSKLHAEERALRLSIEEAEAELSARRRAEADREARRVATEQAERAFALAEAAESKRFRRAAHTLGMEAAEAAKTLLLRARLLVAAALALGAPEAECRALALRITEAERAPDPRTRLTLADGHVRGALALIGKSRAEREGDVELEVASLVEAARAYGFAVERREDGLQVRARDASPRSLARLTALAQSFPRGGLVLLGSAKAQSALERSLAPTENAAAGARGDSPAPARRTLVRAPEDAAPPGLLFVVAGLAAPPRSP